MSLSQDVHGRVPSLYAEVPEKSHHEGRHPFLVTRMIEYCWKQGINDNCT